MTNRKVNNQVQIAENVVQMVRQVWKYATDYIGYVHIKTVIPIFSLFFPQFSQNIDGFRQNDSQGF